MYLRFDSNFNYKIHSLRKFQRFFICLKSMKDGFVNGHTTFIRIKGLCLKGSYKGVLLLSAALNANNGLFIIAYAIIKV